MSWGYKVTIGFCAFVFLIAFMVYKAMRTNFDLVTKDYYQQELVYQDKLNAIKNANAISEVAIQQKEDIVEIFLPHEVSGLDIKGEAWFYCKTDALKDKKIPIVINEKGVFVVAKNSLHKTKYDIKLSYSAGNTAYYSEEKIEIN